MAAGIRTLAAGRAMAGACRCVALGIPARRRGSGLAAAVPAALRRGAACSRLLAAGRASNGASGRERVRVTVRADRALSRRVRPPHLLEQPGELESR